MKYQRAAARSILGFQVRDGLRDSRAIRCAMIEMATTISCHRHPGFAHSEDTGGEGSGHVAK